MSKFSNSDYLRALTPESSSVSKSTLMLAGAVGAGLVLLSITILIHYRRQIEILKERNEALLAKLEAARLSAALADNNIVGDEADSESDN